MLFLADIPDQVRLLTIYGKLKMGFRNASGQEVAFTVPTEPGSGYGHHAADASTSPRRRAPWTPRR